MAYHQVDVRTSPKPEMRFGPREDDRYALDLIGQDDGADPRPGAAFRLIFQLGQGYSTYLYVVGMGRGPFHSFWTKGVVGVDAEMEEWGPRPYVACDLRDLPPVYERVQLSRGGGASEAFRVERFAFRARPTGEPVPDLV